MKYQLSAVLDGLSRYINSEIMTSMNDLQEVIARIAVGRVIDNEANIKHYLSTNGIIRSMGIVDADGYVDVESLFADLKKEVERKGKITISIPLFGKLTFDPSDIDTIKQYVTGVRT